MSDRLWSRRFARLSAYVMQVNLHQINRCEVIWCVLHTHLNRMGLTP
jgi:hypothetical protein